MADDQSKPTSNDLIQWIARIGVLATLFTALILTSVLVGNTLLLVFKVPASPQLRLLVELGPVLGVFFGNISTGIGYYGNWRILRGSDAYDVHSDAKSHAGNVPGLLQGAPEMLAGCFPTVSVLLLAASLVTSLLTLGPAPINPLGTALQPGGSGGSGGSHTSNTPPTSQTHLHFALGGASIQQQCTSPSATLAVITVTLDNSASTADANWQLAQVDPITGTGVLWASADQTQGTVAASHSASLDLTPDVALCAHVPVQGAAYQATLTVTGGGSTQGETISDRVAAPPTAVKTPPGSPRGTPTGSPPTGSPPTNPPTNPPSPVAMLSAHSTSATQTCDGSIAPYPVVLDASGSNVPVTWTFAATDTASDGRAWASASPAGDTLQPGASETITITPITGVCALGGTTATYHAAITPGGAHHFTAFTLTDTITVKAHAAPSANPARQSEICTNGAAGPFDVTLDNSASNVAIAWTFSATGSWATAAPSGGTLAAGASTRLTITPGRSTCTGVGATTYSAQIVPSGGYTFAALALSDTITASVVFAPTLDGSSSHSQSCTAPVDAYTVTLDNSRSNVAATWTFSAQERVRDGQPWATASPPGGTIPPGQRQTIQVIPDPNATRCAATDATTYHATFSFTGGGQRTQLTITDSITRPGH